MAKGGYRSWAATDRFQADWDLRNLQLAVAIARKVLWDAIAARAEPAVCLAMKADLVRLLQRQAEAEREVERIERHAFENGVAHHNSEPETLNSELSDRRVA